MLSLSYIGYYEYSSAGLLEYSTSTVLVLITVGVRVRMRQRSDEVRHKQPCREGLNVNESEVKIENFYAGENQS